MFLSCPPKIPYEHCILVEPCLCFLPSHLNISSKWAQIGLLLLLQVLSIGNCRRKNFFINLLSCHICLLFCSYQLMIAEWISVCYLCQPAQWWMTLMQVPLKLLVGHCVIIDSWNYCESNNKFYLNYGCHYPLWWWMNQIRWNHSFTHEKTRHSSLREFWLGNVLHWLLG